MFPLTETTPLLNEAAKAATLTLAPVALVVVSPPVLNSVASFPNSEGKDDADAVGAEPVPPLVPQVNPPLPLAVKTAPAGVPAGGHVTTQVLGASGTPAELVRHCACIEIFLKIKLNKTKVTVKQYSCLTYGNPYPVLP